MEENWISGDSSTEEAAMDDVQSKQDGSDLGDGSVRAKDLDIVDLGDAMEGIASQSIGDTAFHASGPLLNRG